MFIFEREHFLAFFCGLLAIAARMTAPEVVAFASAISKQATTVAAQAQMHVTPGAPGP